MGAKGSVRTFENLLGVGVRTSVQLPPSRCMRDGSTLMPSPDTRRHGSRQGCTAGRSRARLEMPVSQVTMGRYTNVLLNRRQNRPAKAGCEAGSKRTWSQGPRAPSPVVCTPVWTRRTARPYGDRPTPSRNGVTSDRLSWDRRLREQVVSRMPGHEVGSPKKPRPGVMPRIC
jgi:hypothetical protein